MDSEFPGNSHTKKAPREPAEAKKVSRVVENEVIRRKKPLGRRISETFFGGGDAKTVWGFVAFDVIIPAAKDTFADAVSQGVERLVFGEARSRGRRTGRHPGDSHINYQRYSGSRRDPRDEPRQQMSRRARASHDFDEIILATRVEADEVLDNMFEIISKFEVATVADLYNLVDIDVSWADDKWGWNDLRGAGVQRIRNGYLLELPRPEPLD